MASSSPHAARHAELHARARGTPVLDQGERTRLFKLAIARKNKKMHFFNTEDGWKLRRLAHGHPVKLASKQFCALCGINTGNSSKLRLGPNSRCETCSVNLCAVPHKEEPGLSCFEQRHQTDYLRRRLYPPSTSQNRSNTSSSSESEARNNPPINTPPRTPPPSTPPRPRRTRTRRRISVSPETSGDDRWNSRRRTDSPGVNRFRVLQEQSERERIARECVEDQAEREDNSWKRSKSVKQMIENLGPVLPPHANAPLFGVLDTPQKIKRASRQAERAVHADTLTLIRPTPSALRQKIAEYAFIAM